MATTDAVLCEGMRLSARALAAEAERRLARAGLRADDAAAAAGVLVFAHASGIDSHGLMHLPAHLRGIARGAVNPRPVHRLTQVRPGAGVLDADNGLGVLAGITASDLAVQMARAAGIGAVAVRNSGHFGAASAFAHRVVNRGAVALILSNASPTVAPRGGRAAVTGTNPIAAGFPRLDGPPVILDFATTASSRARIRKAATAGDPIPSGWALDAQGRPTTDANAALGGTMQALGGGKGAVVGLLVELLAAGLAGGAPGVEVRPPQDTSAAPGVSHLFLAFDPEAFGLEDAVATRVARIAAAVEATPPADPSAPVRLPGARAEAARASAEAQGITITRALLAVFSDADAILLEMAGGPVA